MPQWLRAGMAIGRRTQHRRKTCAWMGGAGGGVGLQMVSRVSLYGLSMKGGEGLGGLGIGCQWLAGLVSRVCV